MSKKIFIGITVLFSTSVFAQSVMTPELLWKLGRVAAESLSADGKQIIYGVTYYDAVTNKGERNLYSVPVDGGEAKQITNTAGMEYNVITMPNGKMGYLYKGSLWEANWNGTDSAEIIQGGEGMENVKFSPDGKYILFTRDVKMRETITDKYPDLDKANAKIIDDLMYRHWDSWEDEKNSHVFYAVYSNGQMGTPHDIMNNEPFDSPQMPFGGAEDVIWSADSKTIYYVSKKKTGKEYALSTNTDIYAYSIASGLTTNITTGMQGYDTNPNISPDGNKLAWLSMERDGYEADKNRLFIMDLKSGNKKDVTKNWDGTVESMRWSNDGNKIFFTAPVQGSIQIFEYDFTKENSRQLSNGVFDVNSLIGQNENNLIIARSDINYANEIFSFNTISGEMKQITTTNNAAYANIQLSKQEFNWVTTTDGKKELVSVIFPPNFDPNKKYPTLLYCQGGPQSALTQYYSFRWNFQLMAANGYIIIAPSRRGMPGFGKEWNEQISKDWGGQAIRDYLSAIDWAKTLPYVDTARCGAVGASYGGYSIYMLEGVHNGRFKTFIAHDGLFNLQTFYGTTEEMWFANWDLGGPYWENGVQDESYNTFNPVNYVSKWNTPILIFQGGKDYRTTEDQAFQAFEAAQLKGIKSRLVYLPDENHWVSSEQDALLWQREFFRWLKETL